MTADYEPGRGGSAAQAVDSVSWLAGVLANETAPVERAGDRFVESLLARYDHDLDGMFRRWRAGGPFEVVEVKAALHKGWATLAAPGGERTVLAVTVDTTGKIRRVVLEEDSRAASGLAFDDVDRALGAVDGVESTGYVGRRGPQGWVPLWTRDAHRQMPGGSVFKVYVLLAAVHAVSAGHARWSDLVTVGPTTRSLPTGEMQDLPDGTRATLAQAAFNMFARSDNTASDMVLEHLGREAVEAAAERSSHSAPDLLRPFPTTRELFDIGWGHPNTLAAWALTSARGRRAMLDEHRHPLRIGVTDLTHAAHPLGLDWWMSSQDVVTAMSSLWELAAAAPDGPLPDILAANPGLEVDRERWPRSTFKGGSSPGAVMFAWLLEDPAGIEHAVVLQQRCPEVGVLRDGLALRRLGDTIIHRLLV
ncbi:serine hydrolase [Jannaschia sp. R86511]|uniref:serine hydrolase n=1 Tax=Jannaschia sp. R86511 TaxID=3093853 RepID=UPI0036D22D9C